MELCVSLDLPSAKENLALAQSLKDKELWLKVVFRTFIRDGKDFLQELKEINPSFKIFLDLKLYDIPNTMADAAQEIASLGLVDMFNLHASAVKEAMQGVMERFKNIPNNPLVISVTALTSFSNEAFKEIYNEDISSKAIKLARDTYEAGVDGVVCSAYESKDIKNHTSSSFITLCPGIRPFGEDAGDQKRVADLTFAKENFVDYIVVGRPIYKANNAKLIVERILEKI